VFAKRFRGGVWSDAVCIGRSDVLAWLGGWKLDHSESS
jgi:hypothetical protein